jgi:hypothetical protein
MRLQVLNAVTMKTIIFGDATRWYPSNMNEAAGHAETSVYSSGPHSITSQKATVFNKLYMWQLQNTACFKKNDPISNNYM